MPNTVRAPNQSDTPAPGKGSNRKISPPGLGWLGALVCIAVIALVIQGVGLSGHLDLLKDRAEWDATRSERQQLLVEWQKQVDGMKKQIEKEKSNIEELGKRKVEAEAETAATQAEVGRKTEELVRIRKELELAGTSRDQAVQERQKAQAQAEFSRADTARLHSESTNLISNISSLSVEKDKLIEIVADLEKRRSAGEKGLSVTKSQVNTAQGLFDQIQKDTSTARDQQAKAQQQLQDVTRQQSKAVADLEFSRTTRSNETVAVSGLRSLKAQIEAILPGLQKTKEELSADILGLEKKVASLRADATAYADEAGKFAAARASVANELQRAHSLQQECNQLAEQIAQTKAEGKKIIEQKNTTSGEVAGLRREQQDLTDKLKLLTTSVTELAKKADAAVRELNAISITKPASGGKQ